MHSPQQQRSGSTNKRIECECTAGLRFAFWGRRICYCLHCVLPVAFAPHFKHSTFGAGRLIVSLCCLLFFIQFYRTNMVGFVFVCFVISKRYPVCVCGIFTLFFCYSIVCLSAFQKMEAQCYQHVRCIRNWMNAVDAWIGLGRQSSLVTKYFQCFPN